MNSEHIALLGDLATWITAIGTIGAFIVAFKQIHTERHERKRRHSKEQEQAEQEQARHISAWIDASHQLVLSNTSSHPVHNVTVEFSDISPIEKHTIAPGQTTLKLTNATDTTKVVDFIFTDTHGGTTWRKVPGETLEKTLASSTR